MGPLRDRVVCHEGEFRGIPAVSYTHLDVYKRQDIYLPDLKYLTPALSERYSGAADYPEAATAAIREMVRQTGPYVLEDGLLKRGVLIRHLLLPGRLPEAKVVMDWVAETFPPGTVLFSLMSQYLPLGRAPDFPELNRRLRPAEARSARDYMAALGLEGFCQESGADDAGFVPAFDPVSYTHLGQCC